MSRDRETQLGARIREVLPKHTDGHGSNLGFSRDTVDELCDLLLRLGESERDGLKIAVSELGRGDSR